MLPIRESHFFRIVWVRLLSVTLGVGSDAGIGFMGVFFIIILYVGGIHDIRNNIILWVIGQLLGK